MSCGPNDAADEFDDMNDMTIMMSVDPDVNTSVHAEKSESAKQSVSGW